MIELLRKEMEKDGVGQIIIYADAYSITGGWPMSHREDLPRVH